MKTFMPKVFKNAECKIHQNLNFICRPSKILKISQMLISTFSSINTLPLLPVVLSVVSVGGA